MLKIEKLKAKAVDRTRSAVLNRTAQPGAQGDAGLHFGLFPLV